MDCLGLKSSGEFHWEKKCWLQGIGERPVSGNKPQEPLLLPRGPSQNLWSNWNTTETILVSGQL